MTARTVTVTAASRLHFGMLSFGQPGERQFGGLGVMIAKPGIQLRISTAPQLDVTGLLAERARSFARRYFEKRGIQNLNCRIEVLQSPPDHVGLGVGTQLALSTVAGLHAWMGHPPCEPGKLAALAGRAERSAIGTYGFIQGGLLMEAGKQLGESIAPLVARADVDERWRFVLVIPRDGKGIHGIDERRAFQELPPVPPATTVRLRQLAAETIVPAAADRQYEEFSAALYEFGHLAGLCFASFQHGAYATERVQHLVERIRGFGCQGVGQSSWGPSVFAVARDEFSAQELVQFLRELPEVQNCDVLVSAPANQGAKIETE